MDWGNIGKALVSIGGDIVTCLYGGWISILGVLVAFVAIDYLTGLMAGAVGQGLSSAVGFKGV